MRFLLMICALPLICVATGCASSGFSGEWLEDPAKVGPNCSLDSPTNEHRLALKFAAPSTVWYGPYIDQIGVVDAKAVQSDSYFLFDGWDKAQFGSMKAKIDGDHMVATIDGDTERYFTRVHGKDIFPPPVTLPELP